MRFELVLASVLSCISLSIPVELIAEEQVAGQQAGKIPFRISKETTYITAPLTETGLVDYAAYLNRKMSKGVTPENNAAILYWKANGKTWDDSRAPGFHPKLIDALSTDPFADGGPYLVPFDQACKEITGLTTSDIDDLWEEYDAAQDAPWKSAEFPEVKRFLDRNEQPLKTVIAATGRSHYYRPFVSTDDKYVLTEMLVVGWYFKQHRDMARMLKTRAMLALGENRPEDATRDLLAIHRLARHSGQGGSMTDMLVGISMEGIACEGDKYLANSKAATTHQLAGYATELSQLPPLVDIERCYQIDRLFSLDLIQKLATQLENDHRREGFMLYLAVSFSPETIKKLVPLLLEQGLDWNQVLIGYNKYYDRIQTAVEQEQYAEQVGAINQLVSERATEFENLDSPVSLKATDSLNPTQRGEQMSVILLGLMGPATQQVHEAFYRGKANASLSLIGIALSAYRKQQSEFPDKLNALVPDYLSKLPNDPYTSKPFVYRRDDEGALVYSLGKNLRDDGGKPLDEDHENHDHVFRVQSR